MAMAKKTLSLKVFFLLKKFFLNHYFSSDFGVFLESLGGLYSVKEERMGDGGVGGASLFPSNVRLTLFQFPSKLCLLNFAS